MSAKSTIAANRFGLGARPGELAIAGQDPQQWLLRQLRPLSFAPGMPTSMDIARSLAGIRQDIRSRKDNPDMLEAGKKARRQFSQSTYRQLSQDTLNRTIVSDQSFAWRLLEFFSNHFSVTAQGPTMTPLAATLEREAIAPKLFGSYGDLLHSVMKHPAMLMYLNNERSFGNNSPLGRRDKGLNENLAREILELHTLGVDGGYSQRDVIELANGISGWSVANTRREKTSGFIFRKRGHEPGKRKLLGKTYPEDGLRQGENMLHDLARHPKTVDHLCLKLARHIVADDPPPSLVKKLSARWQETDGNLRDVYAALVEASECWSKQRLKFKTPREFIVSSFRAIGSSDVDARMYRSSFAQLGQAPFKAGSPAGYPDKEQDWIGGSALIARIDWAARVARQNRAEAVSVMRNSLANTVSQRTSFRVKRSESRQQALTMLLMSPEFQRR